MTKARTLEIRELSEINRLSEVDSIINADPLNLPPGELIWYLWRFKRADKLEITRKVLSHEFDTNTKMHFNLLEFYYNLLELHPESQKKEKIRVFRRMIERLVQAGPAQQAQKSIISIGFGLEREFPNVLNASHPLAEPILSGLESREHALLELATLSRAIETPRAIVGNTSNGWSVVSQYSERPTLDLFVGPYFFQNLSESQRAAGKIPDSFSSPFRGGLRSVIDCFLELGGAVIPWITWRGGIAPVTAPSGGLMMSYHTKSADPCHLHYKFGHFSDLMQIDSSGYAGFSTYTQKSIESVHEDCSNFSNSEISELVHYYRNKYILERKTWRVQGSSKVPDFSAFRRKVFVPLQDPLDEVASLAYLPQSELLVALSKFLPDDIAIVVKRHPVDNTKVTDRLLQEVENDPRLFVVDASIHSIFEIVEEVICVNSGVGFEALLAGLKVTTTGACDYARGSRVLRSVEELKSVVAQENGWPSNEVAEKVLFHYFKIFVMDPEFPQCSKEKIRRILKSSLDT